MRNRQRTACVVTLCSLLLAACGGSGGGIGGVGAGDGGNAGIPDDGTTGTLLRDEYGSYAGWNSSVEGAFPLLETCSAPCATPVPADPGDVVSAFGDTAAFDPATDQWEATWTGDMVGIRHSGSPGTGLARRWTGTAKLEIRATDRGNVRFWGENMRHNLEAGGMSTTAPDGIPTDSAAAWVAALSTTAGEKGYFSGDKVFGQFAPPETPGATPDSALGHITNDDHVALFEVAK